jgi:2-iminobutanoate/2-iminopropanoate deaminase
VTRRAITGDAPTSSLPFSPAVRAGDLVFVSGQASVDDQGAYVSDDLEGELTRSLDNVERVLAAAGGTLEDVVQVRGYVADAADLPRYNAVYAARFGRPYPARTTIVTGLGGLKVEIDVVAYLPRAGDDADG